MEPACDGEPDRPLEGSQWLLRITTPTSGYSLAADGTVIEVARRDIFASIEDYRTWRVSQAAVDAALGAVADLTLADAELPVEGEFWLEVLDPCVPRVSAGTRGLAAATAMVVITDHDERVTEPELWQPDDLWLNVHPADLIGTPNEPTDPFVPWPLPGTIADHVVGHDRYREDVDGGVPVRLVCLRGDDVTPLWQLQQPGTRNTWIRLEDAEGRWEVSISPTWPGYRRSGNPCGTED